MYHYPTGCPERIALDDGLGHVPGDSLPLLHGRIICGSAARRRSASLGRALLFREADRLRTLLRALSSLVLAGALTASLADGAVQFTQVEINRILQHSPLPHPPVDASNGVCDSKGASALGRALFFDARLSSNNRVSCATCHVPEKGFSDGRQLAEGLSPGQRHTPTLWNVAYNRWFFWDGRADSLWAQALHPLERPDEMGGSRVAVALHILRTAELRSRYEGVFGDLPDVSDAARFPPLARPLQPSEADGAASAAWAAMTDEDRRAINRVFANVGKSLAAYQRMIVSDEAPFDRFVRGLRASFNEEAGVGAAPSGDENAISEPAKRGLKLFVGRANCRTCHSGPNFTDGEFHAVRVPPLGGGAPRDAGRYLGIQLLKADMFNGLSEFSDDRSEAARRRLASLRESPELWGLYKTPTLRNVAVTSPYMHQGQFATLRDVLLHYSKFENALSSGHHAQERTLEPLNLTDGEIEDLVAFLQSLTDTRRLSELTPQAP